MRNTLLLAATATAIVTSIPTSCEAFVSVDRGNPRKCTEKSIQYGTVPRIPVVPLRSRKASYHNRASKKGNGADDDLASKVFGMKVVELKAELKSHGQPTTGLKAVLQQRLVDFYLESTNSLELDQPGSDDCEAVEEAEQQEVYLLQVDDEEMQDEEDNNEDNDDYVIEDEDDTNGRSWMFSKKKWKNKTFLLMEDARKLVHSNDVSVRKRGPKKAMEAVRRMQQWLSRSLSDSDEVDFELTSDQKSTLLKGYNLWIHALAKSEEEDAGFQAERVLKEMQRNVSRGGPIPDEITIGSVMDAHAHSATVSSSSGSGAKAAEAFLFRLLEKHEATTSKGDVPWSQDSDNALNDSLIVTCDTMLNALAREGTMESAERAQLIVLRLEEYQRQLAKQRKRVRPKGIQKNSSEKEGIIPSTSTRKRPISYATVMNAWANVGSVEAAEKAEATLESLVIRAKMDAKEKSNVNEGESILVSVHPDTIVFNSVIQCWATARHIKSGKKSMRLLEQMKELSNMNRIQNKDGDSDKIYFDTHPDIITYNTVLSAWSHCGDKNAAPKAEKIVKELVMEREENRNKQTNRLGSTDDDTTVVVNTVTFNTVLDAWSKSKLSGANDRAEKLLEFMIQSNDPDIAPDIYSFTCVMDAFAKSKQPNKASNTQKLLDRLIQMHDEALKSGDRRAAEALRPSQIPYNTVLNACAFSAMHTPPEEQKDAIQIAVDTYKSMSSRISLPSFRRKGDGRIVSRDTVTYGLMLKCIANLMPRGKIRSRMALQIFQESCDDGLVGFMVWNEIRRSVPGKLLQETYGFRRQCGSLDVEDLPKEWRKNSKEKRFSKQRHQQQSDRHRKTKSNPPETKPKNRTFIVEKSFATGKDM